jgi:hypothetical protein
VSRLTTGPGSMRVQIRSEITSSQRNSVPTGIRASWVPSFPPCDATRDPRKLSTAGSEERPWTGTAPSQDKEAGKRIDWPESGRLSRHPPHGAQKRLPRHLIHGPEGGSTGKAATVCSYRARSRAAVAGRDLARMEEIRGIGCWKRKIHRRQTIGPGNDLDQSGVGLPPRTEAIEEQMPQAFSFIACGQAG